MNERNEMNVRSESPAAVDEAPSRGGNSPRKPVSVTLNEIHRLAFRKWSAAGRPEGDHTRFWQEAERELLEGT